MLMKLYLLPLFFVMSFPKSCASVRGAKPDAAPKVTTVYALDVCPMTALHPFVF